MKLGVFTVLFQDLPFEQMLETVKAHGLETVELGTGNYPGNVHCNPEILLSDGAALDSFRESLKRFEVQISALSCQGNPLHPNTRLARDAHHTWRQTVLLAERLGLNTVNVFSGCPGDSEKSERPNWVTCAWPPDYEETLKWQWEKQLLPYWAQEAKYAADHGVNRIAFEMHPGFMVYNPETLLKLREAVGPQIGANYDPSHLRWQGMDAATTVKVLGAAGALFHVHAKDVYLDQENIRRHGILDTKPYGQILSRSWTFRSVGYGMSEGTWREIISTLRMVGYDGAISIEHEDSLASVNEGFQKAVDLLQRILFREPAGEIWWA